MKNMTLENIAKACGGTYYGPETALGIEIQGAVLDSRKVEKDYLFFAVKGNRVDGHDFVDDVYQKGALCVICERKINTEKPYIVVPSSLEALKKIAEFYRENLDITVVGITGSVGKTSTKEYIASVLEEKFCVLKTEGNFNNEIGVPLTLLRIREEHQVAVVEMGISDFGEMHRLSRMVKPNICVMTNIGLCHLEKLGTRDGILKAKSEIFDYAADNCTVILNGDDDKLQTITEVHGRTPWFFGMDEKNRIYAKQIVNRGVYGTEAVICLNGEDMRVSFSLPGNHTIYNAMAASAVGLAMNMEMEAIKRGLENAKTIGGRLHIIDTGSYTVIDDCYNANPVSVASSLSVLNLAEGRKVAVLGDMFELGEKEKELHRDVGHLFKELDIDVALFVGKLSAETCEGVKESETRTECYHYQTVGDLLMFLDLMIKEGDTILVKASHSMHFEEIVQKLCEAEKGKDEQTDNRK